MSIFPSYTSFTFPSSEVMSRAFSLTELPPLVVLLTINLAPDFDSAFRSFIEFAFFNCESKSAVKPSFAFIFSSFRL